MVYISLGSNLGDRLANLERALDLLSLVCLELTSSRVYETVPLFYRPQPLFLNLAARGRTTLPPQRLLKLIHDIERRLGRRPGRRNGPRPIDIDILIYGSLVIDSETLTVPHPGLTERRFVLRPLLELDPALTHPVTGTPLWKYLLAGDPGGVYFHSICRYTTRSLIPLTGRAIPEEKQNIWKRQNFK
jgi:2-amino-4-hydroxy-6-hydroxymethyldihydropteridine diphosphokinase